MNTSGYSSQWEEVRDKLRTAKKDGDGSGAKGGLTEHEVIEIYRDFENSSLWDFRDDLRDKNNKEAKDFYNTVLKKIDKNGDKKISSREFVTYVGVNHGGVGNVKSNMSQQEEEESKNGKSSHGKTKVKDSKDNLTAANAKNDMFTDVFSSVTSTEVLTKDEVKRVINNVFKNANNLKYKDSEGKEQSVNMNDGVDNKEYRVIKNKVVKELQGEKDKDLKTTGINGNTKELVESTGYLTDYAKTVFNVADHDDDGWITGEKLKAICNRLSLSYDKDTIKIENDNFYNIQAFKDVLNNVAIKSENEKTPDQTS